MINYDKKLFLKHLYTLFLTTGSFSTLAIAYNSRYDDIDSSDISVNSISSDENLESLEYGNNNSNSNSNRLKEFNVSYLSNGTFIEKKLLDKNYSLGKTIVPKYIVVHDTANTVEGADADNHYKYWSNAKRNTSAHFVVDDKKVIQLLEPIWEGWHTNKLFVENPNVPEARNENSIGIELCVNEDGDFLETFYNGLELVKELMLEYDIHPDNVITHNDATGKSCPKVIIKDNEHLWEYFKEEVNAHYELNCDKVDYNQ